MPTGSTAKTILGTLFIIILLIILVMGGLFVYRRFYDKKPINLSIHFENPRSVMEAARVKMGKLNERVNRKNNSSRNDTPHNSTMIEEQENNDLTSPHGHDETRQLI